MENTCNKHEFITLRAVNILGSQTALSTYLEIPQSNISNWMRGKVKIPEKHLEAIMALITKEEPNAA